MPSPNIRVPKDIHFSIVGPVVGWEFSVLAIWAGVNPLHTVHVWAPERLIYQKILYSLLFSERNKITIEKDYPVDLAQLRDSIWAKVDSFMGKDAAIESLNIMTSDFSDNVKTAFNIQITRVNNFLNEIKNSISNAEVHKDTGHFEKVNSDFIRHSLSFTNPIIIERYIGLTHEYDLGGVYIDKGIMPKLKRDPFLKRGNLLDPISGTAVGDERRKQLERAKIRAVLEKLFSEKIIQDPAPYFEAYDKNLPKVLLSQIKGIVDNTPIGDLFHALEEHSLSASGRYKIFLNTKVNSEENIVARSLAATIQPIMVASRLRNPVFKMLLDEMRFLQETAGNLRKSSINIEELLPGTKESIEKFYRENRVTVSGDRIDKVVRMLPALSDNTREFDYDIINQLGYDAFQRIIKLQINGRPLIRLTDNLLANTPFYNRESYNPDMDDLHIVREREYDKLIVINVCDNNDAKAQSLTKSYDIYKMYKTEKGSVLYDAVDVSPKGGKKLITVKGEPPNNIGEDTRVIITGMLYYPDRLSQSSSFFSREIVAELSSLLNMAIPTDTTVQSITFFFDNSAQNIPGSAGTLDASRRDYVIPEVLRELTRVRIRANTAVAVRGPLSAGVPQQTTGGDSGGPAASEDRPYSELNRIVFTLTNDNTVTYQARFGLASLAPQIKFTGIRHKVGHTSTEPEVRRTDTGPEVRHTDTGPKEDLIKTVVEHEFIEAGLKEDLIKVEVRSKPVDETTKENLIDTIVHHKSIDSELKVTLVTAIVGDKFGPTPLETDSSVEARPASQGEVRAPVVVIDSSIEAESDSDRSEDEVRRPTNDFALQDNRKDASQYSLYDDFQEALLHGLVEQPATEKVVFANPDRRQTVRMEDTLRLALVSSSYQEWFVLYACLHTEPYEVHQLERAMSSFQSEEAKKRAFATLKRRVEVRSYDIYPLDHTKAGDVATLNALFKNDFENISVFRNLSSVSCSRQRRSADSASCHARRKELANALRLLSGSSTQLNLEDHTDIALLNTSDEGKLWLQAIFTRFRRQEGKAALADTRGMHSVIAMDDTSFTRAQKRIKAGTLNGQPLLLRATPSAGYVLLKPDGRVQSAIAGGDGNRVTLIGRPARLITRALTTLVTDFAPGGRIATLTVSNLANSDQPRGIIALNALKNFMTQSPANGKPLVGELIIEPRSQSIRTFKRMVKDIERLMPKDRPAIDTLVLRSPASGQPEYRLFPGETTVLIPPRPSDSKALRYLPPRASGHTLVPAKLQSATVDSLSIVASKRSEFRQRLLEFGSALSDIKARHSLPDSMVPQLDTLRRDVRGWRMDFMEPDTLARKNIRFTSGALGRFRGFLQKEGRQGMLVKGKKTSTGSLERLRSFIGLYDLMTGIAPIGHHYKNSSPGNMTDTQQQIYIGRQTVFYTAMALQGIEMIDLGRRGIKVIAPAVLPSLPSNKAAPKLPANSGSKLPGGLKKAKGAGKKAARFIPLAGFGVQATSLTLTVIEYETEEDPEVKELLKSRVIFESVDAAVSIISDFAGPFGFMIDGIMHFVRNIFDSHYQRKLNRLNYKKLREVSGKAAQVFDPMHAQLDPGSFLASNQTLNALISGDDKNPLILNIKSINLVNQTLTYGGGYSNRTTFVARSNKDWDSKKCKNVPPMVKITHKCATEVNRIDYSSVPFNLIDDALATLCKKESRLTGYQCENGVFHNLGQMTDKLIILMPSVPEWEARLRYTPFAYDEEKDFPGSSPDSSSPGAQLLDAVSDSKLKRFYRKKVARKQLTKHTVDGSSTISYLYKYLGQMLTGTDGLKFRHSTTSLYLNNKNHIVFFREVDDEFSKLLDYDLYSPKGANNTNVLMSNGGHRIRLHPRGSASTWMLSYDGELPYICITQWEGLSVRCSSELNQSEKTWTLTLGETRFQFPAPTPDVSYRVMAEDVNGLFEWRRDGKVIHRLYDTGGLNDKSSRASKLNRIMSRYTRRASRFLRLELKDCDFSPQIRARCMAGAPEQWLKIWLAPEKPQPWKLNSAFDPPPMGPDRPSRIEQNPAWLQRKQDCDRQVNEYLQKPYRCFPDKLGLPRAQWGQLDRIRLWYDTLHGEEIRLLALSDLQPVQGSPATGYYFFDRDKGRVLFQTAGALNREIKHLHELDASKYGTWFGNSVSKTVRVKDDSQLLVFDAPYYYLLTASPSGQLTHQVIAAETLDDQLSVPPAPSITASNTTPSNQRLIPFRVVDDYANRRLLKTGFYDDDTRTHIAFLSSLLDGEAPSNTDDGSRLRTINEPVRRVLREEHLPVHKVVRGQSVYYIMFSKHSGNLHHFSTDMERPGSVQRLSSGFQLIRPAGENRTVAEIAGQHIFTRVQAHSGSLLADTLSGYRLLIPDKAWDNTRVVSENLSLESGPFKHWQVEATGQMVAKSNDTLSVHQFTPQSGLVMDSLNLGWIVNLVFTRVTYEHPGTTWTTASAGLFIRALKQRLRSRVEQAREQFSARVGLVPLRPITAITDHPLLNPFRQLDFWYFPDGETLLAANTRDRFEVMVNDDGQLLALSDTRKQEAFEFFLRPDQGAKGHPFCGEADSIPLTGVPSVFDDLISTPCRYTLPGVRLRGSYQWEPGARAWRIQTPEAQYLANRQHVTLVALDFSWMGSREASNDRIFLTRQDFNRAVRSLPGDIKVRIDAGLIALRLRPGYAPTQTAWIDYRGRHSSQQRLMFGLPDREHSVQQLIGHAVGGSKKTFWFLRSPATVVYSQDQKTLYRITPRGYQSLGTFNRVAVLAGGLLLSGTPGADQISLEALRLDTYYREHQVAFVKNGTRQRFGVLVEGQGGSDVIELDEPDLSFFARIIIHPGLAEENLAGEKTAVDDQTQTRIELNAPAFLFIAERRGQDLRLVNRFSTGDAEIEIREVWAKQNDRLLQPTILVFSDLELPLSDLAERVMGSGQGMVFPLTVSSLLVGEERLRFIKATASNPLYIQRDQSVKIVTHQAMDGIMLILQPLDTAYIRRHVFITGTGLFTGTGQWGWEPGSVQVSGPEPRSGYHSWSFIPAVISSSTVGNGTARLWGNSRNNVLYLGADARQWSLQGRGGHDLLLLGASGKTAARPEVLASLNDRCDNRKLNAPGNNSLWQAILDWTRPLAGGVGNDVYDLRACKPARTIDNHGKHYILLSSGSKADLRQLSGDKSTALFFTDLTAEQVAFSRCDPQAQSNLTRSNYSLPSESQTLRIINTATNQTLALVKPDVLASLYFKGGQVSLNPMAVINSNESTLTVGDSDEGEDGALAYLNSIIVRGQRLVNYLCSLVAGEKGDVEMGLAETKRPVMANLNDTELYQHYQRLVQDLSALSGNRSGERPSFIPSTSQGSMQNLTTPQPSTRIGQG